MYLVIPIMPCTRWLPHPGIPPTIIRGRDEKQRPKVPLIAQTVTGRSGPHRPRQGAKSSSLKLGCPRLCFREERDPYFRWILALLATNTRYSQYVIRRQLYIISILAETPELALNLRSKCRELDLLTGGQRGAQTCRRSTTT